MLCTQILDAVRAAGESEDGLQDSVQAAFARLVKLHLVERAPPAFLPLLPVGVHPDAVVRHSLHISK